MLSFPERYECSSSCQWSSAQAICTFALHWQVVKSATVNGNGAITALELIQRTPKSDVDEWDLLLSETLSDWYSPQDSARFTKEVITVAAPVVIDATEFGDVLMTAKLTVGQGVERPSELSPPGSDDQCGQAATLTFFMELLDTPPTTPDPAPPGGTAGGANFSAVGCCCPTTVSNSGQCDYRGIWSYRRAVSRKSAPSWSEINAGDVSQQNWGNPSGNDLDNGYMFVSLDDARASVEAGTWAGGVNLTALSMLEQRAYGWFHAYAAAFPTEYWNRFVLNRSITGTSTGLSKLPYLRDTRRAVGLNGYRLTHYNESAPSDGSKYGMRPLDAVAFGNYGELFVHSVLPMSPDGPLLIAGADDHNIVTCSKPEYMSSASTVPYYIPFRALTHGEAPNLLVAGKTMAMTFYANSAARLHPAEWSSGVAAGAAAVIMTRHSSTTSELYTHWVPELQKLLTAVGAPLYWS